MKKSRRKQSHPSRLADVGEDTPPSDAATTSKDPANTPNPGPGAHHQNGVSSTQAKNKKFSDFSISALSNGRKQPSARPSTTAQVSPFSSVDFSAAQKAYEALLEGMELDKSGCKSSTNAFSMAASLLGSPFNSVNPFGFDPSNNTNPLLSLSKQVDGLKGRAGGARGLHPDWMSVSKAGAKSVPVLRSPAANGCGSTDKGKSSNHRKRPASSGTANGASDNGIDLPCTSSKALTEADYALDLSFKKSCTSSFNHLQPNNKGSKTTPISTPSTSNPKSKPTAYLSPTAHSTTSKQSEKSSADALNQLSSLVTKAGAEIHPFFSKTCSTSNGPSIGDVGHLSSLWFSSNFDDKLDHTETGSVDPSSIFTCLQCFERFQSMEQLVKHMEKTRHFNAPTFSKHLAGSNGTGSTGNGRSTTVSPSSNKADPRSSAKSQNPPSSSSKPANKEASKTWASSNGAVGATKSSSSSKHHHGTFSFKCIICGHSSSENSINEHMTKSHSFTSPNEWISAVKLIPL